MFHCDPIPTNYAKVMVLEIHPDHLVHDLDFSIERGIKYLGNAKNNFMLWNWCGIVLRPIA